MKSGEIKFGEQVQPAPVSEELIQELERTGAHPDFVIALRRDRKRFLLRQAEAEKTREKLQRSKERLHKLVEYYKNDDQKEIQPVEIPSGPWECPNNISKYPIRETIAAVSLGLLVGFTLGVMVVLCL